MCPSGKHTHALYFTSVNLFTVLFPLSFPTPTPASWLQYSWASGCLLLQWTNLDHQPDIPLSPEALFRWRQKGLVIHSGLWQKVSVLWQITNFLNSYTIASLNLATYQGKKKPTHRPLNHPKIEVSFYFQSLERDWEEKGNVAKSFWKEHIFLMSAQCAPGRVQTKWHIQTPLLNTLQVLHKHPFIFMYKYLVRLLHKLNS